VDRLIALVALRLKLDLRAVLGARGRLLGLVVALPAVVVLSAAASVVAFALVRLVERAQPELLLPLLSALATLLGLLWALSPLLGGVALSEAHDLGRLLRYPVPLGALVVSSLAANLLQPMTLAHLPPLFALAFGLSGPHLGLLLAVAGLLLAFALVVAAGQGVGLALHALSRNRRLHDRAVFAGIGLGVLLSLVPWLLLGGYGGPIRRALGALVAHDIFALSPFAWGVRGAVHAARGDGPTFLAWSGAAMLALVSILGVTARLAQRMYYGDLDLGEAGAGSSTRARRWLPGRIGALVDKDLRVVWRDPRLKALVLTSLVAPSILLLFAWQGSGGGDGMRPGLLLLLASFSGLSTLGANAFALERRGVQMLFGFPVERFRILVAKNLGQILLRAPGLVVIASATALLASPVYVPAAIVLVLLTQLLAAAADNYLSVLHPVPVPAPGQNPNAPASGTRGLASAAIVTGAMLGALVLSSPFAFLAWLPHLLGERWLWALTLPLAIAGTLAVYGMLTAGAASLLTRREPDLIASVLGEE
jgi:ABC-2 type transport system permease protein